MNSRHTPSPRTSLSDSDQGRRPPSAPPPRGGGNQGGGRSGWIGAIKKAVFVCVGLGLCGLLVAVLAVGLTWPNLPNLHAMTDYRPSVPLRIYTADKVLIGEFGEEHRNVMRFAEFPDSLKQAILAAEDDNFYSHGGVDWMGVARAAITNTLRGARNQGASTITMQVARNFYLSSDKTFLRKFYELLLTFKIERELTKDQIFELYMNQIYLGHRSYGFAAATRTYLGKNVSELTPAESALLAGIPKAPSRANPITNFERAQIRQRYILGRMHSLGYLDEAAYKKALDEELHIGRARPDDAPTLAVHGEYPAEIARQSAVALYGEQAYTRGIDVYTTIDSKSQAAAYSAVRERVLEYTRRAPYPGPEARIDLPEGVESDATKLDELLDAAYEKTADSDNLLTAVVLSASPDKVVVARSARDIITITDKKALAVVARALAPNAAADLRITRGAVVHIYKNGENWEIVNMPAVQAALVSVVPEDGAITAMIGGFDFWRGHFNRATQAFRQPGSSIKPFVYAAGLERGLTPATQISDQPFTLTAAQTGSRAWSPKNDNNRYEPFLTMRQALYRSKNMVTIRIAQAITPQYAQEYLTRFGFEAERWPAVLPLALGAGGATPLQIASAYAVFGNGGYRVDPYLVARVTDRAGHELVRAQPVKAGADAPRAIDPRTAWIMDDMLRGVARSGTGARATATLKRTDIGGKTGTTNNSVDVWFAGYTPALATSVWLGFDQPRSLGSQIFGSGLALSTWTDYMQVALKGVPVAKPRPQPEGLIVDNGEYYYAEFPPGQAVASLDLPAESSLDDFLNNAQPSDGSLGGFGGALRPNNGWGNDGSRPLAPLPESSGAAPASNPVRDIPPIPVPGL
ncbi:MAG: PBP1A family penicillin-binding protein [Burkholderiaceae bacterium]